MRRLLFLALLLPLGLSLGGCALLGDLVQRPSVSLRRVDVTSVSFQGIAVNFVLAVNNPNPIGVDLARLVYQITVDGHQFADGHTNSAAHVPAQGTGEVVIPVGIKFVDFAQSLASLFTKQKVPYTLATKLGFGTPAGVLEIPLSTSGTLPVPRLPDVHIASARLGEVGLTGATFNLLLGVHNPNTFAVPLGALSYRVTVAGSPVIASSAPGGQLAAGASNPLQISAHLDFLALGMGVARAIQSGGAEVALDGALQVGGYSMPLRLTTRL
ncbi:MAG: LEA type 2 family protein [Polyangia bacterium]|jgi:LEA14-like dessication related protein